MLAFCWEPTWALLLAKSANPPHALHYRPPYTVTCHELPPGSHSHEPHYSALLTPSAGLGFCQDLNLLSTEPADIVETCNMVYGLLLQHQKDSKFKEQLKNGESGTVTGWWLGG